MPSWILKSATHRILSWLPRAQTWNSLLQTYVTRSMRFDAGGFEFKLSRCRKMLDEIPLAEEAGFTVLELGTGWYPIIPVGLYLCGAKEVWTVDVQPLANTERVLEVLRMFRSYADRDTLRRILPRVRPDRIAELRRALDDTDGVSAIQLLQRLRINAVIGAIPPSLPSRSIDFIFSESVLVHIPTPVLGRIFTEFRRLISDDGTMIHSIILSDHYSRFDSRITEFNMLRFSRTAWRLLNSPLEYQNRLRVSDYRLLHQRCGFEIRREENTQGDASRLRAVRLHPDFHRHSTADLLVVYTWMVSAPARKEAQVLGTLQPLEP